MTILKGVSVIAFAAGLAFGAPTPVFAQSKGDVIGELAVNEGIFVDPETFKIAKGKAKGDPAEAILKVNAKEVGPGAIVFRSGDKLYIVEGSPRVPPQAMKDFQEKWVTRMKNFQDNWKSNAKDPKHSEAYLAAMKNFQDSWANYMKDFQDDWKSNMTMKDFQDNWANNMKNFQDEWKSNMKTEASAQAMKDFQDEWKSNMKNFQDEWKSNMKETTSLKDFQDNWATSYVK